MRTYTAQLAEALATSIMGLSRFTGLPARLIQLAYQTTDGSGEWLRQLAALADYREHTKAYTLTAYTLSAYMAGVLDTDQLRAASWVTQPLRKIAALEEEDRRELLAMAEESGWSDQTLDDLQSYVSSPNGSGGGDTPPTISSPDVPNVPGPTNGPPGG